MAVLGFGFTKLMVERTAALKGNVNINNNVGIKDVTEFEVTNGKKTEKALKFKFEFISSYDPDGAGKILIEGELATLSDEKSVKATLDSWKKNKSVPRETLVPVLGYVLDKCNVEAVVLSRELGLPVPIPLPKVDSQAQTVAKEAKK